MPKTIKTDLSPIERLFMPTNTWKGRERQVAEFFGGRRTPLSGINSGHTSADVIHDHLFVEQKHRKRHSILTLFRAVMKLARKENKIPVVTLTEHGRKGFWILVHSSDLTAVANQRSLAKKGEIELTLKTSELKRWSPTDITRTGRTHENFNRKD